MRSPCGRPPAVILRSAATKDPDSTRAPVAIDPGILRCAQDDAERTKLGASKSESPQSTSIVPSLTITLSPPIRISTTSPSFFSTLASSTLGRPISTPWAIR